MKATISQLPKPFASLLSRISAAPQQGARLSQQIKPYLFLLPALVLILFWVYKPLVQTLSLALCSWTMVPGTTPKFVGLSNFSRLISNKDFLPAVLNTVFYTLGMLPFSVVIPLLLAVATQNVNQKARSIYRALYFIPMITAPVATSTIFQWLCAPGTGLLNQILAALGVVEAGISFFTDPKLSRVVILIISGWKMLGFSTILFSAALTGVNTQYYEAARLDGAKVFRQFWDVTLPMISPTIMLLLMMSILFSSQWTFAYIDVLSQGGPYGMSTNIYYLMYKFAFSDLNVGLSAAAATMFMVLFGILAVLLQRANRKLAFYDN